MECVLEKVNKNEKEILYKLLQYSLFEESLTDLNEMNQEAEFEYKWFDLYFDKSSENDRKAYFIKDEKKEKLLGFVMVNSYLEKDKTKNGYSIAEFMVIPKYRKKGIGRNAALQIFDMYKGYWEVKPSYGSESAFLFWENVISKYTNNEYEYSNEIFSFTKLK